MRNNYVGWIIGLIIGVVALFWALYVKHRREKMRWKYYSYTDEIRDKQRIVQLTEDISQAGASLESLRNRITNEKRINESLHEWNKAMGIEAKER